MLLFSKSMLLLLLGVVSSMLLARTDAATHPTCPSWLSLSYLQSRDLCPPGGPHGCVRDASMCGADKPVCCTPDWCPTYGICTDSSGFCRDVDSQLVSHGEQYAVDSDDPCSMCTCINGRPENCQTLRCGEPPACAGYSQVSGRCCEFECPNDVYGDPITGIRLVGGHSPREGRVELLYNGTWGTVCDDNFNEKAARVVCRMLGYEAPFYTAIVSKFGPANGAIHFRDTTCFGNEQSIWWCMRGVRSCTHFEDVGVSCLVTGQAPSGVHAEGEPSSPFPTEPTRVSSRFTTRDNGIPSTCQRSSTVRLVGGQADWMGRVEVFHDRQWGTVCDDFWGVKNAEVVCRSLCMGSDYSMVYQDSLIPPGNGTIWLDDVRCSGDEAVIERCKHAVWGSNNCQHEEDVAIACKPLENLMSQALSIDSERWPVVRCRTDSVSACFDLADVGNDATKVKLTVEGSDELDTCRQGRRVNPIAFESADIAAGTYTEFSNGTFKCVRISRNGCGTRQDMNQTHFIYTNAVTRTNSAPSAGGSFKFIVQCAAQRYYSPLSAKYKTYVPQVIIQKSYLYQVSMCFCNPLANPTDPCVTDDTFEIARGSLLQACIILTTKERNMEIVVHNCTIQASLQAPEAQKMYLIRDKCRREESVIFSPWTAHMYAFEFQARQYLEIQETVYVVCQAYVCNEDDSSYMCDRSCNYREKDEQPNGFDPNARGFNPNRRQRRSAAGHYASTEASGTSDFVQVHLGPIRLRDLPQALTNFNPEEFVRHNLTKTIPPHNNNRIEKSEMPEKFVDFRAFEESNSLPFAEERAAVSQSSAPSSSSGAQLARLVKKVEAATFTSQAPSVKFQWCLWLVALMNLM